MMGVYFGDRHSYKDFGLELEEYNVPLPAIKEQRESVPGMDGDLDYTEYPDGVKFESVTLSFTFRCLHPQKYFEVRRELGAYFHGKTFKITIDTNEEYYYTGRCEINTFKSNPATLSITVKCICFPWARRHITTKIEKTISQADTVLNLHNERMPITPKITVTAATEIETANGTVYTLPAGTVKLLDLRLGEGLTTWKVRTAAALSGTIKIEYRMGAF